jgi:Mg2+-importing ATPase
MDFLRELFAGFVRTRHFVRHFRRLIVFDSLRETTVVREMPASLAERLLAASRSDLDALWTEMPSHPEGLTDDEASAIRERVGPNEVDHEKPLPCGSISGSATAPRSVCCSLSLRWCRI